MRHTDGNCDGNTGNANRDCNGSMYSRLCGDDLDRQYGGTRHDTSGGQQL
jgi:hypothetical protein